MADEETLPLQTLPLVLTFLPSSGISYRLLMAFANGLDPVQIRRSIWPELGLNCLTL